jgi:hypothetical protein
MKPQDIINELLKEFETKTRDNGTTFVCLKNEKSPVYEVIYGLHDGLFPRDWIFDKVEHLLISMSENCEAETIEDLRETAPEYADSAVDIYNHELIEWSKDFYSYIDEYNEEIGSANTGFVDSIRGGQWYMLEQMAHRILDKVDELYQDQDAIKKARGES